MSMLQPACLSLPQVWQLTHLRGQRNWAGKMIWDMENAGCFGITLQVATETQHLLCGTACSCWLRHVTAFHTTASRLSPAVSLRLSSDSPHQATNLWVTLSIPRSTVCKSFRSLSKDDLTRSCKCVCRVSLFGKIAAVRTFSAQHCI